jgi:cold-inducible RNA-binding protein
MTFDTTQSELEALFSELGEVRDVFLPTERDTGRPRGFAFVEFAQQEAAAEAIKKFDGYELHGRNLRVNEAEERPRRSPGFSDGGSGGPPKRGPKPKGSRRNARSRKRGF